MAMSGVWGKLWGADPLLDTDTADKEGTDTDTSGEDTAQKEQEAEDDGGQPPESVDAFGEMDEPPLTDIGIGGGPRANGGAETEGEAEQEGSAGIDGTETAITTDDLSDVKEQMTDEDKTELFELLMDKLPQESLQTISQFVENGLTEQELTDIQQIMAQHLDKTEYEQMMAILKKY